MKVFARTYTKRQARRFLAGMAAGAILAGTGIGYAGHADASPGLGCETIRSAVSA